MYTDFYGLIRAPFGTTPDADNLFLSPEPSRGIGLDFVRDQRAKRHRPCHGRSRRRQNHHPASLPSNRRPPEAVVSTSTENRSSLQPEYDVSTAC
jgi:hypothetical protein